MRQPVFKKGDTVKTYSASCIARYGDLVFTVNNEYQDQRGFIMVDCSATRLGAGFRRDQIYHYTKDLSKLTTTCFPATGGFTPEDYL